MLVLGLISGTSLDGIDAALTEVRAEGSRLHCDLRSFASVPYSQQLRGALFGLLDPATAPQPPVVTLRDVCALNFAVGEEFAAAAQRIAASSVEQPQLIASHGQTVYHLIQADGREPFLRSTLQIGEAAVIAERTGVTCVADFRVADVAAGGEGAPLVSYADYELLREPAESRVLLNIGGIANLTVIEKGAAAKDVYAFDTGPGNMLVDRAIRMLFDARQPYDEGGAIAKRARVDRSLLQWLREHPYFSRAAPKTTGHEDFGAGFFTTAWLRGRSADCSREDFVATLTALTAHTIADAIPQNIDRIVVSGGGAHNEALMDMLAGRLRERFAKPPVLSLSSEFGLPVDAKEAMVFALLGYRALQGRHNSLPSCTGARQAAVLGKIVPGANYAQLMRSTWQETARD
ncbi:MAG TPA: anhydro-N-acetylmuramic acid kinase [Candidatus Eremiobacteraceae bacterium]|nr:anhydro-N-acetylmuramic acid kinase [Candidatus Eremiobacteraceae bacterium]